MLAPDGTLEIGSATADIGTGTYTILTQIAAEMLGLPMDKVRVKIGDSDLPFCTRRGRILDSGIGRFGGNGGL